MTILETRPKHGDASDGAPPGTALGARVSRLDGPAKIQGAALYALEHHPADLAHAVLMQSTIAAGHVLMTGHPLRFQTKAGILAVSRHGDMLELDLPAPALTEVHEPDLNRALGLSDGPAWLAEGCNDAAIIEVADEAAVRAVEPDFAALRQIHRMAVVTARGNSEDIVDRVFVPYLGIDEDPVTGSAHAALAPYWASRLGRNEFTALQASKRTGLLQCRLEGDRVHLGGRCHTVIVGQFQL